jgi:hypothetical protein
MFEVSRLLVVAGVLALLAAPPPEKPSAAQIDKLVEKLGDDDEDTWRDAGKRLEAIGEQALLSLRKAARSAKDVDVRLRAAVVARAIVERLYGEVRRFGPPHSLVQCVAFLPDGRRVLSGSDDACLHLWDAQTGKEVRRFTGHIQRVMSVAASPDGKRALTGGQDGTVRLWDLEAGKELRRFTGHGNWVLHVAFSADGKQALSCSGGHWDLSWKNGADPTARLWDVETGKEIKRFEGHTGLVFHVAFLSGEKQIVTSSTDRTVRLWDVKTGKEVRKLTGHTNEVWHTAVSPDGKRLLSGSMDHTLRLCDAGTGKQLRVIKADMGFAQVAFTPDGKRFATRSWYGADRGVRLWDLKTGQEVHRFGWDEGWPTAFAISRDGKQLVTGDNRGQLRLWRMGK